THVGSKDHMNDQATCQRLVENDLTWLHDIYFLPETLFLNGLGYRNLQGAGDHPCTMEGELSPFIFHANWTIGFDNKRRLLASTGTWLLGDTPPTDQQRAGSGTEAAPDTLAGTQPPALLTVIYPAYDTRGDIVERVRAWTEAQDFDS